jgi:hypothetical protein
LRAEADGTDNEVDENMDVAIYATAKKLPGM